jgi:hypothetical protein
MTPAGRPEETRSWKSTEGLSALITQDSRNLADASAMAGIDWVHVLSLASLVLAIGAICILLFAM